MIRKIKAAMIVPMLAGCLLSILSCSQSSNGQTPLKEQDGQRLFIGDSIAVAKTSYGKVRGYILDDVYTYLGIPYGAPTSGKNRFMKAQEPAPWEDIRPAVFYGNVAPQITDNKYPNDYSVFADHWNYYDVSEDCLTLNVWTPSPDNVKRPVLVWLHGGGYINGNAIEQDGYHGGNLSHEGNIVFVSVNHRLGPMGFSDFSAVDPAFAESGNVGITDIVAALKWVNENISNFGGDPSNVTIMGQSGGGAKVCTLVAMAETEGLISKAVALSGNTIGAIDSNYSSELGKYIFSKIGSIEKLQNMPWEEYYDVASKAAAEFNVRNSNGMMRGSFGPVGDGIHIPMGVFYSVTSAPSAKIPMLFCTTTAEFSISRDNANLEAMNWNDAVSFVKDKLQKENAEAIIKAYKAAFPDYKPVEIVDLVIASRERVIEAANAKANQSAPVYLAWFGYRNPLFDGRMRAFHCSDICYWFLNTDRMVTHTGGGSVPRNLSKAMSSALLAFMRTGNPNCEALPQWPEYTPQEGATMMLDVRCSVRNDPDRKARELMN